MGTLNWPFLFTLYKPFQQVRLRYSKPAKARPLWIAAYAAAGFGLLAKGLIGIVIPGAVFVLWSLAERRPRRILDAISVPGLAVFALIVVPWFWLMEQRVPGFAATFFLHHHVARFVETKFNNAIGPWFYPVVLALLC